MSTLKKNKIKFSVNRDLSTKLPEIKQPKLMDNEGFSNSLVLSLPESINDLFLKAVDDNDDFDENEALTHADDNSNLVFLDEYFFHAFNIALKKIPESSENKPVVLGIDLLTNGKYNSRMAYADAAKKAQASSIGKPPNVVDVHIGNIDTIEVDDDEERQTAEKFQKLIDSAFRCLDKKYNQFTDKEKKPKGADFEIVEKNGTAYISFGPNKLYSGERVITKYFEYLLKTFDEENLNKKLKDFCVAIPSDFTTIQRTCLKDCFEKLSIKKFTMTTKPVAIGAPVLLAAKEEGAQAIVVDFASGYLSVTQMSLDSNELVAVKKHVDDKSITLNDLADSYMTALTTEIKKKGLAVPKAYKLEQYLENALQTYGEQLEAAEDISTVPQVLVVDVEGTKIELDMTKFKTDEIVKAAVQKIIKEGFTEEEIVEKTKNLVISASPLVSKFLANGLSIMFQNAKLVVQSTSNSIAKSTSMLAQYKKLGVNVADILPYSISISIYNGTLMKLVGKNSTYPCAGGHLFQTVHFNQKTIRVLVYEGDRLLARNSKCIGELIIHNIPQTSEGRTKCQLSLRLDTNGVLSSDAQEIVEKKKLNVLINQNIDFNIVNKYAVKEFNLNEDAVQPQEKELYEKLDQLDILIEYLQYVCQSAPRENKEKVLLKTTRAKNYIARNRFTITADDCDQIQFELEECADENSIQRRKSIAIPASQVFKNNNNNNNNNQSKTCVIS